ncbi:MAG: nitroreductase family deazaflavin-dependent oxidoreductase [Acidimicrobiales bacterium]|nr:nitroreductase family deazaflavin-dependent oxidoreductase [Acidimicrobiales bacterium]
MASGSSPEKTAGSPFLPPRWFIRAAWKVHRALYRWSGGRFGLRAARPGRYGLARLTTIGRRSGFERSVMIGYYEDGKNIVTMAMNGWGAPEPAWWLNLQAEPNAKLETVDGQIKVTGRAAEGEERERLWERWREIDEGLDGYAGRRPTETAVVVLAPSQNLS